MTGRAHFQQGSGKSWVAKLGIWITSEDGKAERRLLVLVSLHKFGCHE